MQLAKHQLQQAYDSYSNFIGLIPEVEERVATLKKDLDNPNSEDTLDRDSKKERIKLWEKVLKHLNNVKNKPKAMKLYYSKKVIKEIKKIKKRYPDKV